MLRTLAYRAVMWASLLIVARHQRQVLPVCRRTTKAPPQVSQALRMFDASLVLPRWRLQEHTIPPVYSKESASFSIKRKRKPSTRCEHRDCTARGVWEETNTGTRAGRRGREQAPGASIRFRRLWPERVVLCQAMDRAEGPVRVLLLQGRQLPTSAVGSCAAQYVSEPGANKQRRVWKRSQSYTARRHWV